MADLTICKHGCSSIDGCTGYCEKKKHTQKVKILVGKYKGKMAYVTWSDDEFLRVTPINDDPMLSIELYHRDVCFFREIGNE